MSLIFYSNKKYNKNRSIRQDTWVILLLLLSSVYKYIT